MLRVVFPADRGEDRRYGFALETIEQAARRHLTDPESQRRLASLGNG